MTKLLATATAFDVPELWQVKPALPKHHLAIAYRIDPGRPNLKPIRDVCHALVAQAAKRK